MDAVDRLLITRSIWPSVPNFVMANYTLMILSNEIIDQVQGFLAFPETHQVHFWGPIRHSFICKGPIAWVAFKSRFRF